MPTQGELESEFRKKWSGAKANLDVKVKVSPDGNSLRSFKSKIEKYLGNNKVKIKTVFDSKGMVKQIRQLNKDVEKLKHDMETPTQLKVGTNGLKKSKEELQQIQNKVKQIVRMEKDLGSLNLKRATGNLGGKELEATTKQIQKLKSSLGSAKRELTSLTGSRGASDKLLSNARSATSGMNHYKRSVAEAKNEQSKLAASSRKAAAATRAEASSARSLKSGFNEEYRIQNRMINAGNREKSVLKEQLSIVRQRNQASMKAAEAEGKLTQATRRALAEQKQMNALKLSQTSAKAADQRLKSSSAFGSLRNMSLMYAGQSVAMGATAIVGQLNEVDKAVTAVTKVVDAPKAAIKGFGNTIYDNATKVGKSASEYASAVEQWASAGYNLKQSVSLAKDSVMGAFVGNVDVNDMVKYMAVPLNAFRKQGLKSKDVINAMNEVANKNAIEMDDLGQAYSKAGSSVASTGTNFSQLTGMVTAAQEGTRAGGDVIGRAIKTISINFSNMGNGLTKQNKIRSAYFKSLGVDLKGSNGQLKSTWQIMDQLAGKWKSMSKSDKQTASWYAAGKEQATQFQAMMDNWDTAKKAAGEAQKQVSLTNKTSGSAFQEFAKQQDSMEFHIAALKNAWGKLITTISGGRDGMNGVIDAGTKLLNVLQKITANKGLMKGLGVTAAVAGFVLLTSKAGQFEKSLRSVGRGTLDTMVGKIDSIGAAFTRMRGQVNEARNSIDGFGGGNNGRKSKYKGKHFAEETESSIGSGVGGTMSRTAGETEKAATSTTKLGRALGVVGKIGGVVMSVLGGINVALDVAAIAFGLLEIAGVHPWKIINESMHPIKTNLDNYSRGLYKVVQANDKLTKSIHKNPVFDGTVSKNMDTYGDLDDKLARVQYRSQQTGNPAAFTSSEFEAYKKEYNALAKKNHLSLRITANNFGSIVEQAHALDVALKQIKQKQTIKLSIKLAKIDKNLDKVFSPKNLQKAMEAGNKALQKARSKVNDDFAKSNAAANPYMNNDKVYKNIKNQQDKITKEFKNGAKLSTFYASKQGRQLEETWAKATSTVQKSIGKISDISAKGGYTRDDYRAQNSTGKRAIRIAQGTNVMEAARQDKIYGNIQNKIKNGKKLSEEELAVLGKQNSALAKKDQSTWGDSERQQATKAITALKQHSATQKEAQENNLREILKGSKLSDQAIEKSIKAYEKGGTSYIDMMAKQGRMGKMMLGVTSQFSTRYGKQWKSTLKGLQGMIDEIPDEKTTKYSLVDAKTGIVSAKKIDSIQNLIDGLKQVPKERITKFGITEDKNGNLNVKSVQHMLNAIPDEYLTDYKVNGVVDAQRLIQDLTINWKSLPSEKKMQLSASLHYDKGFKQGLKQMVNSKGLTATVKFLADNHNFGKSQVQIDNWLNSLSTKEHPINIKVNAETVKKDFGTLKDNLDKLSKTPVTAGNKDQLKNQLSQYKDWLKSDKDAAKKLGIKLDTKGIDKQIAGLDKKISGGKKSKSKKVTAKVEIKGVKDSNSKLKSINSKMKTLDNKKANATVKVKGAQDANKKISGINKDFKKLKGKKANPKVEVKGAKDANKKISGINKDFKKLKSKKASPKVSVKGASDANKKITGINKSFKKLPKSKTTKVTAKTSGTKDIKTLHSNIKNTKSKSVKVKANASGANGVKNLAKANKSVKSKSVKVKSKTSGKGSVDKLHSSIKNVKSKTVHAKAKVSGKGAVNSLKGAIKGLKGKSVTVKAHVHGTKSVNNLANAIARVHDKSVNVTTHKTTIKTTKHKNGSVRIGSPQSITTSNPAKSMSVVTGDPTVAPLVNEAARQMGIGVRDSSDEVDDTRVSEDYWRYMPKQLYTGQNLDTQMSKIEDAITQAGTDINKIIRLNQQKIALDQKQINYQNSLRGSYNAQMSSVLSQLRGYGFHTSGNQITNAGHAASFKGDKASKVDSLLSTYQSVYQSLGEIDTKISNLKTDIWQTNQTIAEQKDQQESDKIEKLQRQLEILTTSIDNSNAIYEKYGSYIGTTDYRLKLQMDASQIQSASGDVGRLINEFNKLSVMNFGNPEQAKKINDSLSTLKTSILAQIDTIETLRQEVQDLKISAITEDLNKFTTSLNGNIDKLKNNVQNLQDGLLSGTTFNDLGSSQFGIVDLSQKTGLEQQAQARLDLEKRLNDALDKFAQKNVDQTAKVANAQLQIEQNKYAQLLNLAKQYSQGYLGNVSGVKTSSVSSSRTDAVDIDDSRSTQYLAASKKYAEDMVKARNAYNQALKDARTDEEKEAVNQQFILQQIDMQRQVYDEIIKADQDAIATLQNKLNSDELTSDQRQKINDAIANYETEITNSQNSIKEAVKSRFDYENQLITDQINKYKDYADTLSNLASIGKSLNVGKDVLDSLYGGQYDSQYAQYAATLDALSRLRKEQSGFQKGSYEYNLLEAEIKEYESGLSSIVTGLLDVTKSQFENTLDGVQEQIEKAVYGGKTSNENEFENNLWISGVDKELTLEAMRQKIATAQLENETVNKQLQYLDGMQKMSKIESDRLDKEIDVLVAQQKLDAAVGNKNVQTIEKDENGKFQWKYVANQADIDSAQEELNTAKKAYQDFLNQSKADYITRVGEVVSGAKDGSLTPEETKQRLAEINESYKGILSDIPGFDSNTVEGIIDAYNKYVSQNRDVINDYGKDSAISGTQSYQEIIKGFGESFKTVSKDLADIIGNELRSILTGTDNVANNMLRSSTQSDSVTIQQLDITLPNVKNGEQFADYMRGFAQVARQSAQGKR
jgi:Phage-related minor tail protein.